MSTPSRLRQQLAATASSLLLVIISLSLRPAPARAQEPVREPSEVEEEQEQQQPPPPQTARGAVFSPFKPLAYRQIGPFRGGRVTAVAGVPSQPLVYYFGATGGGVW